MKSIYPFPKRSLDYALAGKVHRLILRNSLDAIIARATVRKLADAAGYDLMSQACLSTAVFGIACDIVNYAGLGHVVISWLKDDPCHTGLEVVCGDCGLASPQLASILQIGGHRTADKLNHLGLKKLVDEFEAGQDPQHGNYVRLVKWL